MLQQKRESSLRERTWGSAQRPGEGPACRGEWVHDPDDVFRILLSNTAATSPVVTELLTCDSVELRNLILNFCHFKYTCLYVAAVSDSTVPELTGLLLALNSYLLSSLLPEPQVWSDSRKPRTAGGRELLPSSPCPRGR